MKQDLGLRVTPQFSQLQVFGILERGLLGYIGIIINAAHLRGQPPPKHCLPDKSGLF